MIFQRIQRILAQPRFSKSPGFSFSEGASLGLSQLYKLCHVKLAFLINQSKWIIYELPSSSAKNDVDIFNRIVIGYIFKRHIKTLRRFLVFIKPRKKWFCKDFQEFFTTLNTAFFLLLIYQHEFDNVKNMQKHLKSSSSNIFKEILLLRTHCNVSVFLNLRSGLTRYNS